MEGRNGMNILFICTGNTCRSPMAEGLCRIKGRKENADINVLSAGLHAFVGQPVSSEAVEALRPRANIAGHKARQVDDTILAAADIVITMTLSHKMTLLSVYPQYASKVFTFTELAEGGGEIDDPYGRSQEVYNSCARKLGRLLDKAWPKIINFENSLEK